MFLIIFYYIVSCKCNCFNYNLILLNTAAVLHKNVIHYDIDNVNCITVNCENAFSGGFSIKNQTCNDTKVHHCEPTEL